MSVPSIGNSRLQGPMLRVCMTLWGLGVENQKTNEGKAQKARMQDEPKSQVGKSKAGALRPL